MNAGSVLDVQGVTVRFGGRRHDVRPHRLASLGVARTLQGVGLYGGLTALENVMVGATTRASAGFWSALLSLPRASRDERELRELALAPWTGSARPRRRRPGPASCRTGCGRGSRWPARWRPSPG